MTGPHLDIFGWKSIFLDLPDANQSYPCTKATVKVGSVVVAEDHLEALFRHRFDRQVGRVGRVRPQLNRILIPENIIFFWGVWEEFPTCP